MSRHTLHLCLDRVHCPLAKTRTLIRTDDPAHPHVCPLGKPECSRELCTAPRPRGTSPFGFVVIFLILASGVFILALQENWLPKEWRQWVNSRLASLPATNTELEAAIRQKQDAETSLAKLREERDRQATELAATKAKAEKEIAMAKEVAAKAQREAAAPPPANKPPPPAGTVADDLAKFFPAAVTSPTKP